MDGYQIINIYTLFIYGKFGYILVSVHTYSDFVDEIFIICFIQL